MMDRREAEELLNRLRNGNDVRGAAIATEREERTLTPSLVTLIAAGFAAYLAKKTGKKGKELRIGVGHDSRMTAEALTEGAKRGLQGVQAYDCGLASTPSMFQSTVLPEAGFDGAIMITASHLPFNRNGMKFFTGEGSIEKEVLAEILIEAAALAETWGTPDAKELIRIDGLSLGEIPALSFDLVSLYAQKMRELICASVQAEDYDHPLSGLHIIVDAGNGAAGFFTSAILEPLGADTTGSVFLEPDGTFPNHVPNPENPAAIEAARKATVEAHADLGVIFDCDGDRGAVVFADGTEVNRNALIALLSVIVSEDYPGSTIVTDSVTSDELAAFLKEKGLKHLRYRRGYKNVIDKGIELNAAGEECRLAIETSGHGAFKENYFSDDGAYIAVRIICRMAQLKKEGKCIESLIATLRHPAEEEEIRYHIKEKDFHAYGEAVVAGFETYAKDQGWTVVSPSYEGVRVAFDDAEVKGWMLIRMSLHDPVLPVNIEAQEKGGCAVILGRLQKYLDGKNLDIL